MHKDLNALLREHRRFRHERDVLAGFIQGAYDAGDYHGAMDILANAISYLDNIMGGKNHERIQTNSKSSKQA